VPRPRNPDGTIRSIASAPILTNRYLIARWVEEETYAQRILGVDLESIAKSIVRAVRGELNPAVPLPKRDGVPVPFPADYHIHPQAVSKAFRRALKRIPRKVIEELRTVDFVRSEKLWLSLQGSLLKSDVKAVFAGVSVLEHMGKVNGYFAPKELKVNGKIETPPPKPEEEPRDSREFQIAVLRALSDRERRIIEKLMDRARERAKQIMASDRALKVGGTLPEPSTEP